jgi:hypothetical protein
MNRTVVVARTGGRLQAKMLVLGLAFAGLVVGYDSRRFLRHTLAQNCKEWR